MPPGTPEDPTSADLTPIREFIRALPAGGSTLIIGATDRGKTTLTGAAAQALAAEFGRVAVVDSDIGQSEIGPPGTVGVAWATADTPRLHDLRPTAAFFAGGITPRAVSLEWLAATAAAIGWARRAGAERILIDTPGDVTGPPARRLFPALALAAAPDAILALTVPNGRRHTDGAAALAALLVRTTGARLLTLPASADAQRKPDSRRALIRRNRLFAALESATEIRFAILGDSAASRVATLGTSLGVGAPVAPHLCRWIGETLHLNHPVGRTAVAHAEIDAGILTVFVETDRPLPAIDTTRSGIVSQHFGVTAVRVLPLSGLIGACVGLLGEGSHVLGIGRFEGLDAATGEAILFAGLRTGALERVRVLQFGRFRLGRDGRFLSDIRPGET